MSKKYLRLIKNLGTCSYCGKNRFNPYFKDLGTNTCTKNCKNSFMILNGDKQHELSKELKLKHRLYGGNRYTTIDWLVLRKRVLLRDNHTCLKCDNKRDLHIDHIVPVSWGKGGYWNIDNLQTLCAYCNLSKSNKNSDRFSPLTPLEIEKSLLQPMLRSEFFAKHGIENFGPKQVRFANQNSDEILCVNRQFKLIQKMRRYKKPKDNPIVKNKSKKLKYDNLINLSHLFPQEIVYLKDLLKIRSLNSLSKRECDAIGIDFSPFFGWQKAYANKVVPRSLLENLYESRYGHNLK